MTNGSRVFPPDLQETARTFGAEAAAFGMIMPTNGPAGADGGSPDFGAALTPVLEAIGGLHAQLTVRIAERAIRLEQAGLRYQAAEDAIVSLITSAGGRGAGK